LFGLETDKKFDINSFWAKKLPFQSLIFETWL